MAGSTMTGPNRKSMVKYDKLYIRVCLIQNDQTDEVLVSTNMGKLGASRPMRAERR